ncbi:NADP-dependent malic enzyme [Alphaproteobacteria bacterium SO-S41]|nr:NADP-dependent malic enzyme [Alphaproteobacteria bacterium SO-S41]
MSKRRPFTDQDALDFHSQGKPGKLEIIASKPMTTQRDLSLAYSPGVAVPVRAIAEDPSKAYDYTSKGNLVAVISNGTAILGLGDLGALASKPVMEGKAVLFKRFADVDSIDIELDAYDVDAFVNSVRYMGPTFGGINLEDIKAPDCFIIEQRLRELMNIPVFHDDQHGTAIITAAGLINALHLTGRDIKTATMVVNGAGSAGIACIELIKAMGMPGENITLCDTKGVIYRGRTEGMNQWKSAHAVETKARTLAEAVTGSDIFLGLSAAGAMTQDMVKSMAAKPIIFACANPDPEITPEDVAAVRDDAIVATGRSDYPNQVNNVLGFPYIFRGALDVRASTINEEMKIAAAWALAELAREDVPDEVAAAYAGPRPTYGPNYIIPVPFDPRLISRIPTAVAKAAMESGVAQKPIEDMEAYGHTLSARLDPIASVIQRLVSVVRANPKKIAFAEGEEEPIIRAAIAYEGNGLGTAVLVGRPDRIHATMRNAGIEDPGIQIVNPQDSHLSGPYTDRLYQRLQRRGALHRDCARMVNYDRNVFAALMVAAGDADTMLTGYTRNYSVALDSVRQVLATGKGKRVIGMSMILNRGRTVFVADTNVHDMPTAVETADIAQMAAGVARRMGFEPRVALLAYSTFGHPTGERSVVQREAVEILAGRDEVDFEFDGEMAADVALNPQAMALYPFCRLTGPANVLVMPAIHSASISTKLLQEIGGATVIGPLLVGLEKSIQICPIGAKMSDIVNMAALAAYDINS